MGVRGCTNSAPDDAQFDAKRVGRLHRCHFVHLKALITFYNVSVFTHIKHWYLSVLRYVPFSSSPTSLHIGLNFGRHWVPLEATFFLTRSLGSSLIDVRDVSVRIAADDPGLRVVYTLLY